MAWEGVSCCHLPCMFLWSPSVTAHPCGDGVLPGTGEPCLDPAVSMELTLFSLLTVGSGLRRRSHTRQCCWRTWYVCPSSSSSFCQGRA